MKRLLVSQASLLLLLAACAIFGWLSPSFFSPQNAVNILQQSASAAIVAGGMTFVLLTAGIDLSVGSIMFLGAAICGKLIVGGQPAWLGIAAMLAVGPVCGLLHGLLITRGRMSPFIVTMGSLFFLRGLGLWISRTRAMNLPEEFTRLGSTTLLGLPLPVWLAAIVLTSLHLLLTRTSFGRQTLAVGYDAVAARKAGVNVRRTLVGVYVISGSCAALGGLAMLPQLGAVSPTFGRDREFEAIAAAVLGGTSLFGGRGNVFPGAVIGSLTIALVLNGLNFINANPYVYPVIIGGVIFVAVLLDSIRRRQAKRPPQILAPREGAKA